MKKEQAKTYKIIAAAAGAVIIVSAAARFAAEAVISSGVHIGNGSAVSLAKENSFETKDFTIESGSYPVRVTRSPDGKIYVRQYAEKGISEKELMQVSKENGRITVKLPAVKIFRPISRRYVELSLPESCGRLSVISASGGITSQCDINAEDFSTDVSSGSFKAGTISAGSICLSSKSGGIKCEKLEGNISISSASGGITAGEINGSFEVKAASGGIRLDKISGSGKISASSGGIKAVFADITEDINISAASGGVKVTIPENADISVFAKSSSGTLRVPEKSGGKYSMNISAASGDISVWEG